MPNTLQNISAAEISQRSLETLMDVLPALSVFTTDFSAEIATEGESVTTHIASQPVSAAITAATTVRKIQVCFFVMLPP